MPASGKTTSLSTSSLGHGKGPGQGSHHVREAGANRSESCKRGSKPSGQTGSNERQNRGSRPPLSPNAIRAKKRSENTTRRGNQQTLATKHRWSNQDLRVAKPEDLRARVKALEQALEALRRQSKQSSTGKSAVHTKATHEGTNGSRVGAKQSNRAPKSCPPSARNADKKKSGKIAAPVRRASAEPSVAGAKRKSTTAQGTKVKPDPSTAMSAKVSPKTGNAPKVAGGTSDSPKVKLRELPRYKGDSYAETLKKGSVAESVKPVLAVNREEIDASIIAKSKKRSLRKLDKRWCDEELTYFLRMEFAFQERTSDTLRLMHGRLSKHLRQYDTSAFTQKEIYEISVNVVDAAMPISTHEQRVRAGMKNEDALDEMRKNNNFVNKGVAGHRGFFKKVMALPSSKA